MKFLDPRLLRFARSTRAFIAVCAVLGTVTGVLVILQAKFLADVIVSVTADHEGWPVVRSTVWLLIAVFAARAVLAWLTEVAAVRASARAKQELREAAVEHVLNLGQAGPAAVDPGGTAALITRGIDALDGYYSRYLPQLLLAVIVPVAVLLTVLGQDLLSAVIIAVTLPLIPVFMALIGMYTRAQVDRQWNTLAALSGHFLDLVSGLPTLKVFGQAKSQASAIRGIGDRYRSTTMGVLRVSFLSSFALELLATLSVALVAVSVGLRLAEGQIVYPVALFVLLLAPEAYLPLRLVGQHFHAAAEGLGAADRLFTILETPSATGGSAEIEAGPLRVSVTGLQVRYPDRGLALGSASFVAEPATVTAIVGGSGGGKSTLLAALLGFVAPAAGDVTIEVAEGARSLSTLDMTAWRRRVSWLPQHAHLTAADLDEGPTIAAVLRAAHHEATDDDLWRALDTAGVANVVAALPDGLSNRLSADGSGLSVGQLQRIALARALITGADLYLLDEPTAALDRETEDAVVVAIDQLAAHGATVIVVAHRPALVDIAHQIVRVERPDETLVEPGPVDPLATTIAGAGW